MYWKLRTQLNNKPMTIIPKSVIFCNSCLTVRSQNRVKITKTQPIQWETRTQLNLKHMTKIQVFLVTAGQLSAAVIRMKNYFIFKNQFILN